MSNKSKSAASDHPDHGLSETVRLESETERVPKRLRELIYELAGHHCSLCDAIFLEIHHIQHTSKGGPTKFENLIALCRNCHRRVHDTGNPTDEQLHHYRARQLVASRLPDVTALSKEDRSILKVLVKASQTDRVAWSKLEGSRQPTGDSEEAISLARRESRFHGLLLQGIAETRTQLVGGIESAKSVVNLETTLTTLGLRWLDYLGSTGREWLLDIDYSDVGAPTTRPNPP